MKHFSIVFADRWTLRHCCVHTQGNGRGIGGSLAVRSSWELGSECRVILVIPERIYD